MRVSLTNYHTYIDETLTFLLQLIHNLSDNNLYVFNIATER
jgi:hypothetical protein